MTGVRVQLRMHRLIESRWTGIALGALGWGLLASYLVFTGDWRVAPVWALVFLLISFSVAWVFVGLKLFDRFPKLNGYLLYPETDETRPNTVSNDGWALKQADYLRSAFRGRAILSSPAEDGLICVPVLLAGIGPLSALLGGVVFGLLHLRRFTYLECIGKSNTYTLACYVVLPHGLLTVILGHLIMNGVAFLGIQIARHKLSKKLRPNPTADPDARKSGAHRSP